MDDFEDFSDTEEIQFAGGLLGGYSDPQKGFNDLSGVSGSIPGILATLSQLPGGGAIVEKIGPILAQVQSIAGIILGMNSGLKTLQTKVFTDLSNAMNTAVNSAVTASNAATNKILTNAGIPLVGAQLGKYSIDAEGNVVDPIGNVVGPPGSTIDPATGNVIDPDGNVVATPADIPPANTGNTGDTGNTSVNNSSSGGGRRKTMKWRNHLTRRKRKNL